MSLHAPSHPVPAGPGQRGLAALEAALILPVLAMVLVLLIEAGMALMTYSSLAEASRTVARMVVQDGDPEAAAGLAPSLLPSLDQESLATEVTMDSDNHTVTVEVRYEYPSMFAALSGIGAPESETFSLAATASMPLP